MTGGSCSSRGPRFRWRTPTASGSSWPGFPPPGPPHGGDGQCPYQDDGSRPAACTADRGTSVMTTGKPCPQHMRTFPRKRCPCNCRGRGDLRDEPVCGTHKGHQCQEGVRTWPGDYARRRADCSSGSSSLLPGLPPCVRSHAGAPAAAQRRGRTSLTPASGGRSSRARKGRFAVLAYAGSCAGSRCVAGGVVSQAPIRRRASVRAAAMTMCPGPGCSVRRSSAALAPAHAAGASVPGAW